MFNTKMPLMYIAGVGLLLGLCAFYAQFRLTESPPVWYDEGLYVQAARSLSQQYAQVIQIAPDTFVGSGFISGGFPFLAPIGLSNRLFGNSIIATREPMALFIMLLVFFAWILIYKLYGKRDAYIALLLVVTLPLLYGNGKNVLGEVPGLVYTVLFLLALLQIELHEFKGVWRYVCAGLMLGLAMATKPIFFLLGLAAAVVLLLRIRSTPLHAKEIFVGLAACLTPLALWFYLQFGFGDNTSVVLAHYANPYSQVSVFSIAIENALRFFKESTPLYCGVLMGLWALSWGVRAYRKEHVSYTESVAFAFSIIIVLAYLRTPGWYRYFFEALVLALLFAPHSLRVVFDEVVRHLPRLKRLLPLTMAPLILVAALQLYQLSFSSWVADHYGSTSSAQAAAYFAHLDPRTMLYVYNVPDALIYVQSKNYYQYIEQPQGDIGVQTLDVLTKGIPDVVVTNGDAYAKHQNYFGGYHLSGSAGPYVILNKQ